MLFIPFSILLFRLGSAYRTKHDSKEVKGANEHRKLMQEKCLFQEWRSKNRKQSEMERVWRIPMKSVGNGLGESPSVYVEKVRNVHR